jgi:hypothetical protein
MPDTDIPFKEKIRSISFGAPRKPRVRVDKEHDLKHVELVHERTGGLAGYESHHSDGTWDCTMRPDVVEYKPFKES